MERSPGNPAPCRTHRRGDTGNRPSLCRKPGDQGKTAQGQTARSTSSRLTAQEGEFAGKCSIVQQIYTSFPFLLPVARTRSFDFFSKPKRVRASPGSNSLTRASSSPSAIATLTRLTREIIPFCSKTRIVPKGTPDREESSSWLMLRFSLWCFTLLATRRNISLGEYRVVTLSPLTTNITLVISKLTH